MVGIGRYEPILIRKLMQELKSSSFSDNLTEMNYYVFQVLTGKEKKYIDLAAYNFRAEKIPPERAGKILWPQRKLTLKKRGIVKETTAPIFPGYLFFEEEKLEPDIYWILKRTGGFIRFLKSNQNIQPIFGEDKQLLLHFLSYGEIVEKSTVWFDRDNRIRVVSGPMKGLEGKIIKVDRRKKRAKIALSLYEESFKVDFGFEILEKVEDHGKNTER